MERNASLDLIKLLMVLMVVGIHTGFLGDLSKLANYLSVNGIFRIAVPVFLIINGFYFYPVVVKNGQLAWFKRVIVLYLVWMSIYCYFWFSVPELNFISFARVIFNFFIGYCHLWYISGMIGAAIIMIVVKKASSRFLAILIAITFMTGVAIQYAGNYHLFSDTILDKMFNYHWSHRNFILFSFPFFSIGFLINKHSLQKMLSVKEASLLAIIGISLLFMESYLNFYQSGREGGFDNFASLILVCPIIFILFANQYVSGRSKDIAMYSTAIYLIHIFIMDIFKEFTELSDSLLTISVIAASGLASFLIVEANRKLRVIL